jgi:hypothetical protein
VLGTYWYLGGAPNLSSECGGEVDFVSDSTMRSYYEKLCEQGIALDAAADLVLFCC